MHRVNSLINYDEIGSIKDYKDENHIIRTGNFYKIDTNRIIYFFYPVNNTIFELPNLIGSNYNEIILKFISKENKFVLTSNDENVNLKNNNITIERLDKIVYVIGEIKNNSTEYFVFPN